MDDIAGGKDIRVFGLSDWLIGKYDSAIRQRRKYRALYNAACFFSDFTEVILAAVRDFICYFYLIYLLKQGLSSSMFVFYIGLISGFAKWFTEITSNFVVMKRCGQQVDDLRDFLELESGSGGERRIPENQFSSLDITFDHVSYRYEGAEEEVLKDVSFTIHQGERLALVGLNGAGKSTLLSLVCADNPQSYACDISLFGRKRGTGESIWEIKKHIGYVSPEMHRAYLKNLPAIEIVASGLHDSIGLYKRPQPEQMAICEWWMDIFGIAELKDNPFLQLSSGEQRLALLARAFVKDPELLILDEPLHGLDTYNRRRVKKIIEAFCHRKDKTMIMVTHYESELPGTITDRIFLKRNR